LLDKKVVKKLHELLLKLITEPAFKFEFAKAFIQYYPVTITEAIKGSNDSLLEEYPLIPTFSVQIFTVPPLTARLVREHNLLGVLLESLTVLFLSCIGEDGRLQVCLAPPFSGSKNLNAYALPTHCPLLGYYYFSGIIAILSKLLVQFALNIFLLFIVNDITK
jgi:hypothetical protein